MERDRRGRGGLQVAARAHLQGDALVPHVGGEPAQAHPTELQRRQRRRVVLVGLDPLGEGRAVDGDVVDDPHPVPEPIRSAPLDGFPDRRQAEGLTRVDGEVEVLATEVLERVEVTGGRVARLGPGDVEARDALVAVADRELGDLGGLGSVPHRRQQ